MHMCMNVFLLLRQSHAACVLEDGAYMCLKTNPSLPHRRLHDLPFGVSDMYQSLHSVTQNFVNHLWTLHRTRV